MMTPILLALLAVAGAPPDSARLIPGDPFPRLRGSYLTGRRAELPAHAGGRVAVLALGFTYDSRLPVEAWAARFRERFAADSEAILYEIPMVGGIARVARRFIDGGMRRGTPLALQENVITVYGDTRSWKRRLGVDLPDAAYLVLLDRRGRIAWMHRGDFSEESFARLAGEIERIGAEDPR
jgi:hypothetical protein